MKPENRGNKRGVHEDGCIRYVIDGPCQSKSDMKRKEFFPTTIKVNHHMCLFVHVVLSHGLRECL